MAKESPSTMSTPYNNKSVQKDKKKNKSKKKHNKNNSQKQKSQINSNSRMKKQDGKDSPPSLTSSIAKQLFKEQKKKSSSTFSQLEQINKDMKLEVDHFEKEFVNGNKDIHVIKSQRIIALMRILEKIIPQT